MQVSENAAIVKCLREPRKAPFHVHSKAVESGYETASHTLTPVTFTWVIFIGASVINFHTPKTRDDKI